MIPYLFGGLVVLCVVLILKLIEITRVPSSLINYKEQFERQRSIHEQMYEERMRAVKALQAAILTYGYVETQDHPDDTYNIPTKCLEIPTALFDNIMGICDRDKDGKETFLNNWHQAVSIQGHCTKDGLSVVQLRMRDPLSVGRAKEILMARAAAKESGQHI